MNKKHTIETNQKKFIENGTFKNIEEYLVLFWGQFQSKNKSMNKIQTTDKIGRSREYKLNLLKAMSDIVIDSPEYLIRTRRRSGFNKSRNNRDILKESGLRRMLIFSSGCFICDNSPHHRHHIIQLQYDGRNTPNNIVHLCRACHEEIHKN